MLDITHNSSKFFSKKRGIMDKDITCGNYMIYNIVQVTVSNLLLNREVIVLLTLNKKSISERYIISKEATLHVTI